MSDESNDINILYERVTSHLSKTSDESNDIDILYERLTSHRPGTIAFLHHQVHLLENLQNSHKDIPLDYEAFLVRW